MTIENDETPTVESSIKFSSQKLIITISFFLFGLFMAWSATVRADGGFKAVFDSEYIRSDQASADFTSVLLTTIFATILLAIALFMKDHSFLQQYRTWISLIFGWSVLKMVYIGTHNFALLIVILIIAPSLYWYYLAYGEISTYLSNRYIVFTFRRLLAMIPLFFGLSFFTFILSNKIGDPVKILLGQQRVNTKVQEAAMKAKFGLDRPLSEQYFKWVWGFIHGDFGLSFKTQQPVNLGFEAFLFETLKMQVTALVLAFTIAVLVGTAAAYYHNTIVDSAVSTVALLGLSMPIFVTGITAILIFGGQGLGWFPSSGAHAISVRLPPRSAGEIIAEDLGSDNWFSPVFWWFVLKVWLTYTMDSLEHLVLPVLTLTFATTATFARLTRGTMLEVMRQDYVLAARANGLSERDVIWKHAFRNVLLPLVTFLGLAIGGILAGAPITETVFTWPGMGLYFLTFLFFLDIPVMLSVTMVITIMILISNLLTDIVYSFIDPRVTI